MKRALVTGASSGIGIEFAKLLAKDSYNLILTARSKEKLEKVADEIQKQFSVEVIVVSHDLSQPGAGIELASKINHLPVDVLINNAGFGDFSLLIDANHSKTVDMLNLNIVNLTELSLIYSKQFVEKHAGMILNVASTAAFQPIPKMSVYAASKAYVLHFTEALHFELKKTGVYVSALCPGPTKTGFEKTAEMKDSTLFDKAAMTPDVVAKKAYKGLKRNQPLIITGFKNAFFARFAETIPFRRLKVWIASKMV